VQPPHLLGRVALARTAQFLGELVALCREFLERSLVERIDPSLEVALGFLRGAGDRRKIVGF
jgi:hypothetical protein